MNLAVISLSNEGSRIAAKLAVSWEACDVFLHAGVTELPHAKRFDRLAELSQEVFPLYQGLVYIAPIGAVVRAIAPCIRHKTVDPAVVAVDVGGRWAVSLLSGHEGGANELAIAVANILDAEPVISTTTEAVKDLIVGVGCRRGAAAGAIVAAIREALSLAGCDLAQRATVGLRRNQGRRARIAGGGPTVGPAVAAGSGGGNPQLDPGIRAFRLRSGKGGPAGGRGARGHLGRKEDAITTSQTNTPRRDRGDRPGKLYVVGIGPGGRQHRTLRAVEAIAESQIVVGYTPYLEAIADLTGGKELVASGMTHEVERCRQALHRAAAGEVVALISSGDAGIYGMAGLALELAEAEDLHVPVEIIPGVTAASAAAAALGAPLMLDFAVISLSDLLVSWEVIRRRLEAVAAADLVVALYNPRSEKRVRQLQEAVEILRAARSGQTPVGHRHRGRSGRPVAGRHRSGSSARAGGRHADRGHHRQQQHAADRPLDGHRPWIFYVERNSIPFKRIEIRSTKENSE